MKKTEKYLQAESIVVQPEIYHHEAIYKAQDYLDAYKEGYEQALSLGSVGQTLADSELDKLLEIISKDLFRMKESYDERRLKNGLDGEGDRRQSFGIGWAAQSVLSMKRLLKSQC